MADPSAFPIVILSFNRPDYLATVLTSLVAQQGVDLAGRRIFLLQDGGRNRFSGRVHCSDSVVLENLDLFRRIVPAGIPLIAPTNLGVALNFDRAERLVFEELAAEAAIFLEDDLVLGPHYLKVLDQLIGLALDDDRIGYVAAYGDHRAKLADQRARASLLQVMGHNWAFGLTRRQWLRQRQYVEQYLSIVRTSDYRGRDHDRIVDLFHSWGLGVPGTSQDIAKSHACILTGTAKVRTYAVFGRYIGAKGVHFNDEQFEKMGFGATEVLDEDLFTLHPPTDAEMREFVTVARRSAMVELVVRKGTPATPLPPLAPSIPSPAPIVADTKQAPRPDAEAPRAEPRPAAAAPNPGPAPVPIKANVLAPVVVSAPVPMSMPLSMPQVATPGEAHMRTRELISQNQFAAAEALGREWLRKAPEFRDKFNHPAFLKELVRAALAEGRLPQARDYAGQLSQQIAPHDPCVEVLFARAYAAAGNMAAAMAEWQSVLRKEPANAEAQRALDLAAVAR